MSTATHIGARDGLHVLVLLVTHPLRVMAGVPDLSPGRRPAAIHYFPKRDRPSPRRR